MLLFRAFILDSVDAVPWAFPMDHKNRVALFGKKMGTWNGKLGA
jgi:hypothetical protein